MPALVWRTVSAWRGSGVTQWSPVVVHDESHVTRMLLSHNKEVLLREKTIRSTSARGPQVAVHLSRHFFILPGLRVSVLLGRQSKATFNCHPLGPAGGPAMG